MTAVLAPSLFSQFWLSPGVPLIGGKVFTYVAGTSTKQATYIDSTQSVQNANPLPLNSLGQGTFWLDPTKLYKIVWTTANDTDPPASPLGSVDNVPGGYLGTIASTQIVYSQTAAELAASVTPVNLYIPHHDAIGKILIERYGNNTTPGTTDMTTAVQSAINVGSQSGVQIMPLATTYGLTAATSITGAWSGSPKGALQMKSNMHFDGQMGATFKMLSGQISSGSPREIEMFYNVGNGSALTNISFKNIIFDFNSAGNQLPTNNTYDCAFITNSSAAGGASARSDDVYIEDCTFTGTPGASCIVMMETNDVGVTMSKNWTIRNCKFIDNGVNSTDHSSIFGWADNVTCEGNTFTATSMCGDSNNNGTGSRCPYEVHGANHRFVNNSVKNHFLGGYVASNYTSECSKIVVSNNNFQVRQSGIVVYREVSNQTAINNVVISNNTFEISDDSCVSALKRMIDCAATYKVTDILIEDNTLVKVGNTVGSTALYLGTQNTAAQAHDRVIFRGNHVYNTVFTAYLFTTATNGLGYVEISDNDSHSLTAAGAYGTPIGITTSGAGTITTLHTSGNKVNTATYGYYLSCNTTNMVVDACQFYSVTTPYFENSGTYTNHYGSFFEKQSATASVTDGATITHGMPLTPTSVIVTSSVAGESAEVTAIGATNFTVALKKWTGGVLTAGTSQTVYWRAKI